MHNELVYRYWSFDHAIDKQPSYAIVNKQLEMNKHHVGVAPHPALQSAIRSAKDLFYSPYPRSKFVTVQGFTFQDKPPPALISTVERTWIIDSGAT